MTAKQFVTALNILNLDADSAAKLFGYSRVWTVYEMRMSTRKARKVPVAAERLLTLLLALGENDRIIAIDYFLHGGKGKLRLTNS